MQIAQDAHCFVCGPENPIGLKAEITVDLEKQAAEATLVIPENFQGWKGVVHGGIISALLDELSIYACRSVAEFFVTAELAVKYLKPVPAGKAVTVRARITEQRRRLHMVASELLIEGEVHAKAEARVMQVRGSTQS